MVIVFAGALGRFPIGGHAWAELQYLLGLRELGHDVFFLEECGEGSWVYNWETEEWSVPINAIASKLTRFGDQPVSLSAGLRYWAESPTGGPEGFGFRLGATYLFPK